MKTNIISKIVIISVIVFIGAYAYAGWGHGRGMGWGGGNGYGCPNFSGGGNGRLNDADYKKMQTLKENFYNDTKGIREDLYKKANELRTEFDKKSPSKSKIKSFQKEISALRAKFAEKSVDFRLEAKKISPDIGTGKGQGYRGRGGRGGCWN
jgi:zinc resistance-associated protein